MQYQDGQILLSASDIMRFMGCQYATVLDLAFLRGEPLKPCEQSEDAELLQKQGYAHESEYLQKLYDRGLKIIKIKQKRFESAVCETNAALAKGADIVFQGAFLSEQWGGRVDFLERIDKPSIFGDFSYEVVDTKLKRHADPKHVLQAVLYSDLLAKVQKIPPEFAHIELSTHKRDSLRLNDYKFYANLAQQHLIGFIKGNQSAFPQRCADCTLCRWRNRCDSVWKSEDSLFQVANIKRSQIKKLTSANIKTMEELGKLNISIRGIADMTQKRLRMQARLQHARKDGAASWQLWQKEPNKGFDLLPKPQKGDLFYDIEGDPYYEDGLEYLHGIWFEDQFIAFWAHNHEEEKQKLICLLDFFRKQLKIYPDMRIYHYAPYEITALRRLTVKYGVGETFLDRLLRERRFIDLYAVVRGAIIASEPNYSIKSMEVFYALSRESEVTTAGGSIVAYENWRETQEQTILDEIEEYNRIDCISTEQLRNWLVSIRPEGPWPPCQESQDDKEVEENERIQQFRNQLKQSNLPNDREKMLFNLGLFHIRERKPAWWAIFDSLNKQEDDLIYDLDALGGLVANGEAWAEKHSVVRTYNYPVQKTKLRTGKSATVPTVENFASIYIKNLDSSNQQISLKIGKKKANLLTDRLTLHPAIPINPKVIEKALRDVIADHCNQQKYIALTDLILRHAPRLAQSVSLTALNNLGSLQATITAITAMQNTVLPIQGPPGTGKTYVTARAILALVRQGKRVGVSSNSHDAIRNVLLGCLAALEDFDPDITLENIELAHKVSGTNDGYPKGYKRIIRCMKNADPPLKEAHIVGGTAFLFSRPEFTQTLDWLFIDEAGQVSLANMLAMGRCAKNIVLVGDPRQLSQVIQGSHPYPASLSCLSWLLEKETTVPADRGIFLPISYRMHPKICQFISQQVYNGLLSSHSNAAKQSLSESKYPSAGVYWLPVKHKNNAQESREEAQEIVNASKDILCGRWADKNTPPRAVRQDDIIIVAPYNAQVNLLRDSLDRVQLRRVRVGTVDQFQGQEAPVCLISMATSSTEDMPRGLEFLFSLNRINVAISRAKALALIFGSPQLRQAKCEKVEHMTLVNMLCALPMYEIPLKDG